MGYGDSQLNHTETNRYMNKICLLTQGRKSRNDTQARVCILFPESML